MALWLLASFIEASNATRSAGVRAASTDELTEGGARKGSRVLTTTSISTKALARKPAGVSTRDKQDSFFIHLYLTEAAYMDFLQDCMDGDYERIEETIREAPSFYPHGFENQALKHSVMLAQTPKLTEYLLKYRSVNPKEMDESTSNSITEAYVHALNFKDITLIRLFVARAYHFERFVSDSIVFREVMDAGDMKTFKQLFTLLESTLKDDKAGFVTQARRLAKSCVRTVGNRDEFLSMVLLKCGLKKNEPKGSNFLAELLKGALIFNKESTLKVLLRVAERFLLPRDLHSLSHSAANLLCKRHGTESRTELENKYVVLYDQLAKNSALRLEENLGQAIYSDEALRYGGIAIWIDHPVMFEKFVSASKPMAPALVELLTARLLTAEPPSAVFGIVQERILQLAAFMSEANVVECFKRYLTSNTGLQETRNFRGQCSMNPERVGLAEAIARLL